MIAVVIFYLHVVFAVYIFAKSYQTEGLMTAFLNLVFIVILFTVGWTISSFFIGFFISDLGYVINLPQNKLLFGIIKLSGFYIPLGDGTARLLPKDSISLVLLSVIELFFYRFYYKTTNV
ncbi:MAG: hypothetical protein FJ216_01560 [Ignavibacteria bacterium]|nr:hypothetical protein [Ignavibacteria bacterium]